MPEFWLKIVQIDVCSFFYVLLMIQGLDKFTVVGGIGRSNTCINMILFVIKKNLTLNHSAPSCIHPEVLSHPLGQDLLSPFWSRFGFRG